MASEQTGALYIVATPIGNLQDITLRAIETLKEVDVVAAEDTRRASQLLKHFSLNKPTLSLHDFNERERAHSILETVLEGKSVALISDAGTPLISDPGFYLVREARLKGIKVIPIPGACAAIAALSASGLPSDKFTFEGFLPAKTEGCKNYLMTLLRETRTMIFYEAPHRLLNTLEVMQVVFGETREVVIARELTKIYESILSGNLPFLISHFTENQDQLRGEIVILLSGAKEEPSQGALLSAEKVLDILLSELPVKQAASLAAKITGERKNVLYKKALGEFSTKKR